MGIVSASLVCMRNTQILEIKVQTKYINHRSCLEIGSLHSFGIGSENEPLDLPYIIIGRGSNLNRSYRESTATIWRNLLKQ